MSQNSCTILLLPSSSYNINSPLQNQLHFKMLVKQNSNNKICQINLRLKLVKLKIQTACMVRIVATLKT